MTFVCWRVWRFFRLGSVFKAAYDGARAVYETVEDVQYVYDTIYEYYEAGDLEYIFAAIGGALVSGYFLWAWSYGGASADSDSDMGFRGERRRWGRGHGHPGGRLG